MVSLGLANSRMKDFYDVRSLSRDFSFDGALLSEGIRKTFERRKTTVPTDPPLVFTKEFFDDGDKKRQWEAFCNKNRNFVPPITLGQVCHEIGSFMIPLLHGLAGKGDIPARWERGAWVG